MPPAIPADPHRQSIAVRSRRQPVMIACLLALALPGAPSLASSLAPQLTPKLAPKLAPKLSSRVALGLTSPEQHHDLLQSPSPLDADPAPKKEEVHPSQPDDLQSAPKASLSAPESAFSTAWIGWLSIPLLAGCLWWLAARETAGSTTASRTASRTGQRQDGVTSDRFALEAHHPKPSQPLNLGDWVRLTAQSSGDLQIDWQISAARKLALRQQGGRQLILRLYDATALNLNHHAAPIAQQYRCSEQRQNLTLRPPDPERDYEAELGYVTTDGRWLSLICSVQVTPLHPAQFIQPNVNHQQSSPLAASQRSGAKLESRVDSQTHPQTQQANPQQANPQHLEGGGSQLATPFLVSPFNARCNCLALAVNLRPQAVRC